MSSAPLATALSWLQALPFSAEMRESVWLFPTIETVHVFALALVVGSIAMVDLRLLGLAFADRAYSQFAREMLSWTWIWFVIAAITGLLMFIANATVYFSATAFRIKMVALLVAGLKK